MTHFTEITSTHTSHHITMLSVLHVTGKTTYRTGKGGRNVRVGEGLFFTENTAGVVCRWMIMCLCSFRSESAPQIHRSSIHHLSLLQPTFSHLPGRDFLLWHSLWKWHEEICMEMRWLPNDFQMVPNYFLLAIFTFSHFNKIIQQQTMSIMHVNN